MKKEKTKKENTSLPKSKKFVFSKRHAAKLKDLLLHVIITKL